MAPAEGALIAEIIAKCSRGLNDSEVGRVVCFIRPLTLAERGLTDNPPALLDAFVAGELAPDTKLPSPTWHQLTSEEAIVVLVLTLTESHGLEHIPLERARSLARGFLACFSGAMTSFTNLEYSFPEDAFDFHRGWERSSLRDGCTARGWPLLGGLEHGIIAVDERRIGILWVSDED